MNAPAFQFISEDWFTPHTWGLNYKEPPKSSGVYLVVHPVVSYKPRKIDWQILYIGSSKNLHERYEGHEVIRLLGEVYGYVRFYFKEEQHYRAVEKKLIGLIQPRFNRQWRGQS